MMLSDMLAFPRTSQHGLPIELNEVFSPDEYSTTKYLNLLSLLKDISTHEFSITPSVLEGDASQNAELLFVNALNPLNPKIFLSLDNFRIMFCRIKWLKLFFRDKAEAIDSIIHANSLDAILKSIRGENNLDTKKLKILTFSHLLFSFNLLFTDALKDEYSGFCGPLAFILGLNALGFTNAADYLWDCPNIFINLTDNLDWISALFSLEMSYLKNLKFEKKDLFFCKLLLVFSDGVQTFKQNCVSIKHINSLRLDLLNFACNSYVYVLDVLPRPIPESIDEKDTDLIVSVMIALTGAEDVSKEIEALEKEMSEKTTEKVAKKSKDFFYQREFSTLEPNDKEILKQIEEFLTSNYFVEFSYEQLYKNHPNPIFKFFIYKSVIRFLKGEIDENAISITPSNGREYLKYIKLIDLALDKLCLSLPKTTTKLRKKIVKECPFITLNEAYLKTLNPANLRDQAFFLDENHWIEDERHYQKSLCELQAFRSKKLFDAIFGCNHRKYIFAIRGGSCSGKTTFILQLLHNLLNLTEIPSELREGIVNMDILKAKMRKRGDFLNVQVHELASEMLSKVLNQLVEWNSGFILDARLITVEKLVEQVMIFAQKMNCNVFLTDLDESLKIMLLRLLLRLPQGEEALPTLNTLVEGFIGIRQNRLKIIAYVNSHPIITHYRLFKGRDPKPIAEKTPENNYIVHNAEKFSKCTACPSKEKIQKILSQTINKVFLKKAKDKGQITEEMANKIAVWKGWSLQDAVFHHVAGHRPRIEEFRKYTKREFSGSWLPPQLTLHLKSEQLLHIRGSDKDWLGKHWLANKFLWSLNPSFNPEAKAFLNAKRGGFEMPIGYFLIPQKEEGIAWGKNLLSKDILSEICEEDCFRLFVHPEMYRHYETLLDKYKFIKPEESKFIGTPTSAYRSWVVGKEGVKPFIVKMGVSLLFLDPSRNISKDSVIKTINTQERLREIKSESKLEIIEENFGLCLPGYSGIIIREIPQVLIEGTGKIFSLSAVMSVERAETENKGVCSLIPGMGSLPLIYEMIDIAVTKGIVGGSVEFIEKYFIEMYLEAIDFLFFRLKSSFCPHGQNLCLRLDKNNLPAAFAYRDIESIKEGPLGYIESYSLYYRYHIFIKLLNVLVNEDVEDISGVPVQTTSEEKYPERSLNCYLNSLGVLTQNEKEKLNKYRIEKRQYLHLLKQLDIKFDTKLKTFFDINGLKMPLPGEKGTKESKVMEQFNRKLWSVRHSDNYSSFVNSPS